MCTLCNTIHYLKSGYVLHSSGTQLVYAVHQTLPFLAEVGLACETSLTLRQLFANQENSLVNCLYCSGSINEHNRTPRCSFGVSAAAWLEQFGVQCLKVNCYLATNPKVEGFRDQGFVLPEVESLRVQSFVAL